VNDAPAWLGWLLLKGQWQHVADGRTIGEAHASLLREARERKVETCRRRALTSGGAPPTKGED
jgi:hypothetical protein